MNAQQINAWMGQQGQWIGRRRTTGKGRGNGHREASHIIELGRQFRVRPGGDYTIGITSFALKLTHARESRPPKIHISINTPANHTSKSVKTFARSDGPGSKHTSQIRASHTTPAATVQTNGESAPAAPMSLATKSPDLVEIQRSLLFHKMAMWRGKPTHCALKRETHDCKPERRP